MSKDNFYKIVIVALLLLNAGVLAFLLAGKGRHEAGGPPDGPRGNRADRMIMERLHLDEQQGQRFDSLKHDHHSQMLDLQREGGELHKELFTLLKSNHIDTVKQHTILGQLEQNNRKKEIVTFEHFRQLRAILRPDQQIDFDDFVEELSNHLLAPHRRDP